MERGGSQTNLNDERVTAEAGAHQSIVKIEMPRESPWKQPAVYVAILALIISVGGEWRRWVALDDIRSKEHDYYEEVNVWQIDAFNRDKDIEQLLKSLDIDVTAKLGPMKPPPVPKEN